MSTVDWRPHWIGPQLHEAHPTWRRALSAWPIRNGAIQLTAATRCAMAADGTRREASRSCTSVPTEWSHQTNKRLFLTKRLEGVPINAEDIEPSELPVLVVTDVPEDDFLDAVTSSGCREVRLPATYPIDAKGDVVGWDRCQPVGQMAFDDGLAGVTCRTAATGAPTDGEEMAWIDRRGWRTPRSHWN